MTEPVDQKLQALFAEAREELDGEALTARVMAGTRRKSLELYLGIGGAALTIILATWLLLGVPLLAFALLVSQALSATLFDLGDGWLAMALMPVNNIASLIILSLKGLHSLRRILTMRSFTG
jgi:hypothetical protein